MQGLHLWTVRHLKYQDRATGCLSTNFCGAEQLFPCVTLDNIILNKYGTRTGVAKLMFDQLNVLNCEHLRDGHSPRDGDHPRMGWLQSLQW